MKDKVVLVTGASGGLGGYVAQAFLDAGATVVGVSRKIQQSEFSSPAFTALPAEISTTARARSMVESVLAVWQAGWGGPYRRRFRCRAVGCGNGRRHLRMFDVNLKSTFYLLRAVLPVIRKTRNGASLRLGAARRSNRARESECTAPEPKLYVELRRDSGLLVDK